VVEDEPALAGYVADGLRDEGMAVELCHRGEPPAGRPGRCAADLMLTAAGEDGDGWSAWAR
jgi:hypothetical protein